MMMATLRAARALRDYWFLLAVLIVIIIARLYPYLGSHHGPLHPEISAKVIAVAVIFLISGLSSKLEEFAASIKHYQLHCVIQGTSFALTPVFVWIVVGMIGWTGFNPYLLLGVTIVGCLPPPVSAAVIITKTVGGNEALAVVSSALGSLLGVVVTPFILLNLMGLKTDVGTLPILLSLSCTIVLPLILGQVVRTRHKTIVSSISHILEPISSFMLLFIIYCAFCDSFSRPSANIDLVELVFVGLMLVGVQLGLMYFLFELLTSFHVVSANATDVVAVLFCATQKSLTLGLPIVSVLFRDSDHLAELSMPVILVEPLQILLGGLLVPQLRKYLEGAMPLAGPEADGI